MDEWEQIKSLRSRGSRLQDELSRTLSHNDWDRVLDILAQTIHLVRAIQELENAANRKEETQARIDSHLPPQPEEFSGPGSGMT